jgi:microcystin degradation protein MlrC
VFQGDAAGREFSGTNTEFGGAFDELLCLGHEPVPLLRAWSMSCGRLTAATLTKLGQQLAAALAGAGPVDGLVLSLHGAMAADGADSGDLELLRVARTALGAGPPIGVCLDLHANVVEQLVREATFVLGYRTYPHIDMGDTGARTARLLTRTLAGEVAPQTRLAKRAMILPPESQGEEGPFGELRKIADERTRPPVLDVALFPVQPWLDVSELGFAVTVTCDQSTATAQALAEEVAALAWSARDRFQVELVDPVDAIARVRADESRPVLLSESADSPTAGAPADSPAVIEALLLHGDGLRSIATLVDAPAVAACAAAGVGASVRVRIGCTLDRRFHHPVELVGRVRVLGNDAFRLTGPFLRGSEVTMGRFAVVESAELSVLLTERPAHTFDPETYRHAGLRPEEADVVHVRSANLFRAAWAPLTTTAYILDLPGASTPNLASLEFVRAPRPLFPLEQ